jgi:hypothetical protein
LSYDDHKDFLEKILTVFLKDHNYVVREQTVKSISLIKDQVGGERYFEIVQKYINQLSSDPNYIYRVTASLFLQQLKNLEKSQLSEIFSVFSNP